MPSWIVRSVEVLCCLILVAYALLFFAFGVEMLQKSGVSVVQLVPTFLGVLLGFVSARIGEWVKAKFDKAKKRRDLACGVIRCLDRNLGLLRQAATELGGRRAPTFPMDGGFLEYARSEVHTLIPSVEDAAAIEHARYEIRHFDMKLEMLRATALGNPGGGAPVWDLVRVTSMHLPIVERAIGEALKVAKKYNE